MKTKSCAALLAFASPRPALVRLLSRGRHAGSADPFSGAYDGSWKSTSGHGGRLKCAFTRADATHYRAHFTAWWLAFHTSYETVFTTQQQGRTLRFSGSQDLGKLRGGVYHYEGSVTGGKWQARYTAHADHGTFAMARK